MSATPEPGFTEEVRQELSRLPAGGNGEVEAELAALLRVSGSLHRRGGTDPSEGWQLSLTTTSGAVARRVFGLLLDRFDVRAELTVREPGGVRRRPTYGVTLGSATAAVCRALGLLDEMGRPVDRLPEEQDRGRAVAYVRGAVLAGGSFSAPGRPAHMEIAVASPSLAEQLAALVGDVVGHTATAAGGDRPRVVMKSGEGIGVLLTTIGATGAFLRWDDRRLRRQLRSDATRLANADAANLRRAIEAAAAQVHAVERLVAAEGWDAVDPDLRPVALARLANPAATLGELGALLDPPLSRSAVHRRMQHIQRLAADADDTGPSA